MSFNKEIIVKNGDGPVIVRLEGELDIFSATLFMEDIEEVLDEYDRHLKLDFSDLEYLDSSGLGSLISILKKQQQSGNKIYIKNANERIRSLFQITKIEDKFEFVGDIQ